MKINLKLGVSLILDWAAPQTSVLPRACAAVQLVNHLLLAVRVVAEDRSRAEAPLLHRLAHIAALPHFLQVFQKREAMLQKLFLDNLGLHESLLLNALHLNGLDLLKRGIAAFTFRLLLLFGVLGIHELDFLVQPQLPLVSEVRQIDWLL